MKSDSMFSFINRLKSLYKGFVFHLSKLYKLRR